MSFKQTLNYSPNFNLKKRVKSQIKFLVFHYTGMKSENDAINLLKRARNQKQNKNAQIT